MSSLGKMQQVQALTIFILSVRYFPQDLSHAVQCGLLPVLVDISSTEQLSVTLQQASINLLHILALSAGY